MPWVYLFFFGGGTGLHFHAQVNLFLEFWGLEVSLHYLPAHRLFTAVQLPCRDYTGKEALLHMVPFHIGNLQAPFQGWPGLSVPTPTANFTSGLFPTMGGSITCYRNLEVFAHTMFFYASKFDVAHLCIVPSYGQWNSRCHAWLLDPFICSLQCP